jgi:hypothetical protein
MDQSCDPGCISDETALALAGVAAAALATIGILLRRAFGLVKRPLALHQH